MDDGTSETQNIPEEVQDIVSGVEIQQTTPAINEEDEGIYLGDLILITSEAYGKVAGEIYYIDETLIRVLPKGVSNKLYDFPIIDNEIDPDLGVTDIKLRPGPRTGFTVLRGFRTGQVLDAFIFSGDRQGKYTIKSVNKEEDSIILSKDEEDTSVNFNFKGIPRDLPFSILQIAPLESDLMTTDDFEEEDISGEAEGDEEVYEDIGEIEVPIYVPIQEAQTKDRIYSEVEQKGDLLSQFISMLDGPSQKNPLYLKRLRALVEIFSTMKNMILQRDDSGEIRGELPVSYIYLADMLKNGSVPLSRPVLRTKRSLFVDNWENEEDPENRVIDRDDYTIKIDYYDTQKSIARDSAPIQTGGDVQMAGTGFSRDLRESFLFYPQGQKFVGDSYRFHQDSEFFRNTIFPEEPISGFKNLPAGTIKKGFSKKSVKMDETVLDLTPQIVRRGLGNTVGKDGKIILEADRADLLSYTLFPFEAASSIGSTRTGRLYEDIKRCSMTSKSTKELVEKYGGDYESGDPRKILVLDPSRVTLANVLFDDYFSQILKFFHPRGQGDLYHILSDVGMTHVELTKEQSITFIGRVDKVVDKYHRVISQLRTTSPQEAPVAEPLLPDFAIQLQSFISSHEPLRILAEKLHTTIPNYKYIDLAHVAYMLLYAQDYFLAALSKDSENIQREMVRSARDDFLRMVREAQLAKRNQENRGFAPKINPCRHVQELEIVRKTKDDGDRLALLARFVTIYQAGRKENWVMCNVCGKDLLCHHELLQVQQFLHPREHESIQKQIILTYAGGTHGGNHICRNCGKPIATLEYDTHIEFDDEGRPMMGRSELVDEEEIEKEKIELALGTPEVRPDDIRFENEDQRKIYTISRQICERVGVFPSPEDYMKIVYKSQEEYNEHTREFTLSAYKKRLAGKKAGTDQQIELQYYEIMSINKISIIACCTLLQIQTVIPEYRVRYTLPGCEPGFKGYPLDMDESPEKSIGINYIACAIAGMPSNMEPWQNTPWMREVSIAKRIDKILQTLKYYMPLVSDDSISQSNLEKKRTYITEIFGKDAIKARVSEKIRPTYKPYISSAFEDDGKVDVLAQGAIRSATNGMVGDILLSNKYIAALHTISKQNAEIIKNSPYANATCCSAPIDQPESFLETKGAELTNYLPRARTIGRPIERQGWAFFPFQTRPQLDIRAEVQLDVAHRIFLSLCYQGDRKGLPHELSHDLMCDWCSMKIMREYYFPDVIWDEKKKASKVVEISDDILRQDVIAQIGEITRERLDDLLATSHKHTHFSFYKSPSPLSRDDFISSLQEIQPPPVEDWATLVQVSMENLGKLRNTSDGLEIAQALGYMSDITTRAKSVIEGIFGRDGAQVTQILEKLANQAPQQIMEVLRSYFLVQFQRIQKGYNPESVNLPREYDLSEQHRDELTRFLLSQHGIIKEINMDRIDQVGANKIDFYIAQISSILTFYSELRKSHIKYGGPFLREIMEIFLYCPLAGMLDMNMEPAQTPRAARIRGEEGGVVEELKKFVLMILQKYRKESMVYSLETIKLEVVKTNEKDRKSILGRMDRLDDDARKVSVVHRMLGIGEWAKMAGKGVWKYDKDYDEQERLMREQYMENVEIGMEEAHHDAGAGYDNQNHQEENDAGE